MKLFFHMSITWNKGQLQDRSSSLVFLHLFSWEFQRTHYFFSTIKKRSVCVIWETYKCAVGKLGKVWISSRYKIAAKSEQVACT